MMVRNSILIWLGFFMTIIGSILIFSLNKIFSFIISKNLPLTPDSKLFEVWREPPMAVTLDFYVFNCTNAHDLKDNTFKPNFVELGPYRFKEYQERVNITWNANHTITYRQVRRWHFDAENSNGRLDDKFTTLNPSPLGASHVTRYWSNIMLLPLSAAIRMVSKSIWLNTTVREYLFDGVSDPLLMMANKMPQLADIKLPGEKIAAFYERNGSALVEGVFNMGTGTDDLSNIGIIKQWNYENRTKYDGRCGELRGSSGGFYPPGRSRDSPADMFLADMCGYVSMGYSEDVVSHGISGYRYVFNSSLLDNGTYDPETVCNCDGECLPRGVVNTTVCRNGGPAFVSLPHFLEADPVYTNSVRGLKPNADKHQFYIILEPMTGLPLEFRGRLQMNVLLQPYPKISLYHDVPKLMFPVVWMDGLVSIPEGYALLLRLFLLLQSVAFYFSIFLLIVGVCVLVCATLRFFNMRRNSSHRAYLNVPTCFRLKPEISPDQYEAKVPEKAAFLKTSTKDKLTS